MEPSWDDVSTVLDFVYPVLGHPLMRPEPGHINSKKVKEDERRKKQQKLRAWELGEETNNDDDDNDDEEDGEHQETGQMGHFFSAGAQLECRHSDNLRRWEVEARRDTEDAEKSFEELSERGRHYEEEAIRVWKERNELPQRDAETHQRIIDLLIEAEKEQDLRLGAKEWSMALEQRAKLDAEVVTQLYKEQDELRHATERLRSEGGVARG
ncbi:vicilin-like seed storage protein At2g18540 [Miscanthus floridulus]|uniref:vicilin-like seed storage protein At2g18540 n=1 Tax=Miscanthus floridulus TaxID=154761 RepID=UPI00345AF7EA